MSAQVGLAEIRSWHAPCSGKIMWTRLARLFVIRTKFDAFLVIWALGLGAVERGIHYLQQYPGTGGKLLFVASTGAVFMAGAHILDSLAHGD
jgi:hypothetical protein